MALEWSSRGKESLSPSALLIRVNQRRRRKALVFIIFKLLNISCDGHEWSKLPPQRLLSLTRTNSQLDNCGNILTRSVQAIDCNSDMQIAHSYSLAREILNLGWSTGKGTGELIKVKCKTKNDCECSLSSEGDTEWMQWILNGKVGGVVVNAEVEELHLRCLWISKRFTQQSLGCWLKLYYSKNDHDALEISCRWTLPKRTREQK